ncbi:MAG TPA: flagellin [Methanosarcina sp.]|nr:flagellin [Methanosarcina sp.]
MWSKFVKNENGFTGLEAAIVLVAFVVVAAVFSYVMLGAGFYTTQKSQEVVHTGVQQASSSVELSGDLIAKGDITNNKIDNVTLFLQLTSGGSSVDMNKTLIVFSAPGTAPTDLTISDAADGTHFSVTERYNDDGNDNYIINRFEKFEVMVNVGQVATTAIGPNDEFQLEIKPPQGASYTIHRTAPASINAIMTLV